MSAPVVTSVKGQRATVLPVLPCSTCSGSRPFSEGRCLACGSAE